MTDVGTTKRRSMTKARRLKIFENHGGICVTCKLPIRAGDKWFVEHIRALELGGEDTDENCGPAHIVTCKAVKDADDHNRAAKAKRVKQKHLGIKKAPTLKSPGFQKFDKPERPRKKTLPFRPLFK